MRFKKEALLIPNFLLITTYMLAEKIYLFFLVEDLTLNTFKKRTALGFIRTKVFILYFGFWYSPHLIFSSSDCIQRRQLLAGFKMDLQDLGELKTYAEYIDHIKLVFVYFVTQSGENRWTTFSSQLKVFGHMFPG